MKTPFKLLIAVPFLLACVSVFALKPVVRTGGHRSYFYKPDINNWLYILKDKKVNVSKVFKMEMGVLKISGESSGYLRTKAEYKNYELHFEYRWTKVLANSGVLVHIQPKDTVWPVCYQVQQKADAAGDIICMNGLWAKECKDSVKFTVPKMNPSNEKPLGEWNSMRILCKGNTIKVYVNDLLQNYVTGLTVNKGFIGFQNEGKPLEFRDLFIRKLIGDEK
ncbi:MAG: DUF1080 domain-containing protein [Paludibacter sp.]